ncbi:MAG: DUF5752 family protein [Acidobacteriota bacterium]
MTSEPPTGSIGFGDLMPNIIQDILMVASRYDFFVLEEEGKFSDGLLNKYVAMDQASPPRFEYVSSGKDALEQLEQRHFDLLLMTHHCVDMPPDQLARRVSSRYPKVPVVMLSFDSAQAMRYAQLPRSQGLAQTFMWTGDPKLLVAVVKSVEDMINVDPDTEGAKVRVIIVVEDSPAFYSAFLPEMYQEVLKQVEHLLPERLNERDRQHRRRARPKILLARNYEEAEGYFDRYRRYLLGIVCDQSFPRQGKLDPQAGSALIRKIREVRPDMPVLLQSREAGQERLAERIGVHFANKNSAHLLREIRRYMKRNFGFGTFVFLTPDGKEVDRARNLSELVEAIKRIPAQSLQFHGERHHFSNWLMARSEFNLASQLRQVQVAEFDTIEGLRSQLVGLLEEFLERQQRGQVADFKHRASMLRRDFTRIGSGSMGGKARGLAFMSKSLADSDIHQRFPEIRILVPQAAVLCTDFFDRFCDRNDLRSKALETVSDQEVEELFLSEPLEDDMTEALRQIVSQVHYPMAVRSSSLHEDSEFQALAGVYKTFMLPNLEATSEEVRLEQLSQAIRLIYASAFSTSARRFLKKSSLPLEQENMAVILQRLVGSRFGDRFYPDFAGVAQSYNYYPARQMKPEDGIAMVALGLGRSVVEGGKALRFCPLYPEILPQMSTTKDALQASQREFYALDLSQESFRPQANLSRFGLEAAEADSTLKNVGATYSSQNDTIYDSIYRQGTRIVNFSGVLKHGCFPLAPLLVQLLEIAEQGMGTPVEIEFAVQMGHSGAPAQMGILQLRPLASVGLDVTVKLGHLDPCTRPLLDGSALGNGVYPGLHDIIYVRPSQFDRSRSHLAAQQIGRFNHKLTQKGRPYLLIAPGRLGTADPNLGIPVSWAQVSGASILVELVESDSHIEASQGSHFFHNLTSMRVGFLSVEIGRKNQQIDLDWLESQPAAEESHGIRHIALNEPVEARLDGRNGRGLVLRCTIG